MISAVILAAGRSTRLGRPKQLLDLDGLPLLSHVLRNAAAANLDEIVLVLGHEAERIAAAIGEWGQRSIVNPDFAAGQSTSVRAGLAVLDPRSEAAIFLLSDQPQVSPAIIDAVTDAYRRTGGPIVVPTYAGRQGNPVLFARPLYPELDRLTGDAGARSIVRAHAADVITVSTGDSPPPRDVDTEEDYAALLASWTPT